MSTGRGPPILPRGHPRQRIRFSDIRRDCLASIIPPARTSAPSTAPLIPTVGPTGTAIAPIPIAAPIPSPPIDMSPPPPTRLSSSGATASCGFTTAEIALSDVRLHPGIIFVMAGSSSTTFTSGRKMDAVDAPSDTSENDMSDHSSGSKLRRRNMSDSPPTV